MNKAITLSIITIFLVFIVGCSQQEPAIEEVTPESEPTIPEPTTSIEETQQIIDEVDALDELEDTELDTEMDDIENVLNQI